MSGLYQFRPRTEGRLGESEQFERLLGYSQVGRDVEAAGLGGRDGLGWMTDGGGLREDGKVPSAEQSGWSGEREETITRRVSRTYGRRRERCRGFGSRLL
jgi:hypothetical protein